MKKLFIIAMMFGIFIPFSTIETKTLQKAYKIGDIGPAGGWIFYDKGNAAGGWRYLEAAPEDLSSESVVWCCSCKSILGAKGLTIGTGINNTQIIMKKCDETECSNVVCDGDLCPEAGCDASQVAARLCVEYNGGGFSDWFMPSKDELNLMYKKLHKAGIGGFNNSGYYWSSSEYDAFHAWTQFFGNGFQSHVFNKFYSHVARPIRAF